MALEIQTQDQRGDRPYHRVFLRKRRTAFVVVTSFAFCICISLASLWLVDLNSTASVALQSSMSDVCGFLQKVATSEVSDSALSAHVHDISRSVPDTESRLRPIDTDQLQQSIVFDVIESSNNGTCRLDVTVSGRGSQFDEQLANSIATRIGEKITTQSAMAFLVKRFREQLQSLIRELERNSLARHSELVQTDTMVSDLNQGLSVIASDLRTFPSDQLASSEDRAPVLNPQERGLLVQILSELQDKLAQADSLDVELQLDEIGKAADSIRKQLDRRGVQPGDPESGKRIEPIRVVNTEIRRGDSTIAALLDSVNGLDTDTIQGKIGLIQQNLREDTAQIKYQASLLGEINDSITNDWIAVESISPVRTVPAGNWPGPVLLVLSGVIACSLGTLAAWGFQPELAMLGYQSASEISDSIGLPVITELSSGLDPESVQSDCLANRTVKMCEIGLFGLALLVLVMCALNSGVRDAFFQDPFFGFSRVIEMFAGGT